MRELRSPGISINFCQSWVMEKKRDVSKERREALPINMELFGNWAKPFNLEQSAKASNYYQAAKCTS